MTKKELVKLANKLSIKVSVFIAVFAMILLIVNTISGERSIYVTGGIALYILITIGSAIYFYNKDEYDYKIKSGDRIAQAVVYEVKGSGEYDGSYQEEEE